MNKFQSLGEVISALRRRFWLILLIAIAGSILTIYLVLQQPKTWETTAVVQIENPRVVAETRTGSAVGGENATQRLRLIEQRLMSRDNLAALMDKFGLFGGSASELSLNERVFQMRQAIRITEILQGQAFQPGGQTPSGLRITVTLDDPQQAADVANDLMFTVIEQSRNRSADRARDALDFFQSEEERILNEIEVQEDEIAAFKRANAASLPDGVTDLRRQLLTLQEAELDIDSQILAVQTNSTRAREETLAREVALLEEQKRLIVTRAEQIRLRIAPAPDVERSLNALERDLSVLQEQFAVIARRKAEAETSQLLEERQQGDRYEVLETALVPDIPTSRSRKKMAIAGGAISLFAGVFVALVLELLNPAIRNASQMERALGVAPVVSIPQLDRPKRRRGTSSGGTSGGGRTPVKTAEPVGATLMTVRTQAAAARRSLADRARGRRRPTQGVPAE